MITTATKPATLQLSEWQQVEARGLALSEEDRMLAERLRADGRLNVDELRDGLRLTARSWVGVVRFCAFEVQVRPKLAGDNLGLVELLSYVGGVACLRRYRSAEVNRLATGGDSFFDLLAMIFADACERLVRGGVLSDYREVEDDLPVVRGRLLADRQLVKRFGRVDRLECRYDEYLRDILENRIIAAALALCYRRVRNSMVGLRVRRLHKLFSEICAYDDLDFHRARDEVFYHRLNEVYREPHDVAFLIADGLGVTDLYSGSARCFAFLLDMNRLFELFVSEWIDSLLGHGAFRVHRQRKDSSIIRIADTEAAYKRVIPDVLVESIAAPPRRVPLDAKYKLYDVRGTASADVYQAFLYAFAYSSPESTRPPAAFLVYPSGQDAGSGLRLHVRTHAGRIGAEIVVAGVHIPSVLAEVSSSTPGPLSERMEVEIMRRLGGGIPARLTGKDAPVLPQAPIA